MNVSKGLGGYRTGDVDAYVIKVLTEYQQALDSLKSQVDALVSENGRLAAEIKSATERLEAFKARSKVWVAAETDARRTARHIEETARYNAEQLVNTAQIEASARRAYVATLDSEISKAKREIDDFVESVKAFLGYATQGPRETEPPAAGRPGAAPGKVAGWILGGTGGATEAAATLSPDGLLKIATSGENLKVVGQNGAAVGQVSSLVLDGASGKVIGYEIASSSMPEAVPDGTVVPASCVIAARSDRLIVNASTLGNLVRPGSLPSAPSASSASEAAAASSEPEAPGVPLVDEALVVDVADEAMAEGVSLPEDAGAEYGEDEFVEPESVGDYDASEPVASIAPPESASEPEPGRAPAPAGASREAEVAEAIRHSQMKYVIGKVAGRNIVGDDGKVIVARGEQITPEVVEKADREGKLAELIVYMVAPGVCPEDIDASEGPGANADGGAEGRGHVS